MTKQTETSVDTETVVDFRLLKTGYCPSLSGKSKLTYQVGCRGEDELTLRILHNSGGGYFSDEWVALSKIQRAIQNDLVNANLTCTSLMPLFVGKSVNTAGFLLAVLKHVGAIRPKGEKSRKYELADMDSFMASAQSLLEPGAAVPVVEEEGKAIDNKKATATNKKAAAKTAIKPPAKSAKKKSEPASPKEA